MTTAQSPFIQHTVATITLVLVLGALLMIWPGILALFLGVFLLLKSCSTEQEPVVLSWPEMGNLSIVFAS
jgi:uncharacterized membrane protein